MCADAYIFETLSVRIKTFYDTYTSVINIGMTKTGDNFRQMQSHIAKICVETNEDIDCQLLVL